MRQPDHSTYREWLSLELDGELSRGQERRLREHLAGCASCRDERRALRALDREMAASRIEVGEDFREEVMEALPTVGWESSHPKSWVAALAIVLVLAAGAAAVAGSTAARLDPAAPFLAALAAVFDLFRSSVVAGAGLLSASWTGLGIALGSLLEQSVWNLVAFGVVVLGLNVVLFRLLRRRGDRAAAVPVHRGTGGE